MQTIFLISIKILALFFLTFNSQAQNTKSIFEKIDSLHNLGQTQTAKKELEKNLTTNSKLDVATRIKANIYLLKLSSYTDEEVVKTTTNNLLNLINKTKLIDEKAILHSMLAEIYWQYYQQNRWRFANRTTTQKFDKTDILTWDLPTLVKQTIFHYQASIDNAEELKNNALKDYQSIISDIDDCQGLLTSLQDFLLYRAIQFYTNHEAQITEPVYKFEINNADYFLPNHSFAKLNISTKDSISLKYYALVNFQKLIAANELKKDDSHLIFIDLKRLKFVYQHATLQNKEDLYLNALLDLEKRFLNAPLYAEIAYEIASFYYERGSKYTAKKTPQYRYDLVKAHQYCQAGIKNTNYKPSSEPYKHIGNTNCKALLERIAEPNFSFKLEYAQIPNTNIKAMVEYKNIDAIHFKIIPLKNYGTINLSPQNITNILSGYEKDKFETLEKINKLNPTDQITVKLPIQKDFQQHSTNIKLNPLPVGNYLILASAKENFTSDKNIIYYTTIVCTNLSYISRTNFDKDNEIYVLNRQTGKTMPDVKIKLIKSKYNYQSREYDQVLYKTYKTDSQGRATFNFKDKDDEYESYQMVLEQNDDVFYPHKYLYGNYYHYYDKDKEDYTTQTYFFTDRSIYRPGQTIYFKGLVIETKGDVKRIKANYKTTVTLYDANYQKIAEQTLTTNEYGSFNGSFTTPTSVLTGNMSISNNNGAIYFNVEEYKRPTFEVTFETPKQTYKLNDKVTIKGIAKAYSGAVINNAKIIYNVKRSTSISPWQPFYRWLYWDPQPDMQIANGTLQTNDKGEFEIIFDAIADPSIDKKINPTFTFTITADVTDINGETRSANSEISLSYKPLLINVKITENIDVAKQNTIKIETTNLQNQIQKANATAKIYLLKQPENPLRKALWQTDTFIMNKSEFKTYFPNEVFDNEDDPLNWDKQKLILEQTFQTPDSLVLNKNKLEQGTYLLEISAKDSMGNDVSYVKTFEAINYNNTENHLSTYWLYKPVNISGEPGQTAKILLGSSARNVPILYEIEHNQKIIHKEWLMLNKEKKMIEIPIKEQYRGNFVVHMTSIFHNQNFAQTQTIYVPHTNKLLDIEFTTFRDKLLPGEQTTFEVKIKDKKGDKLAAELLCSMYDKSLDAFSPHYWYFNILNYYNSYNHWDTNGSFRIANNSYFIHTLDDKLNYEYRQEPTLNWFGFSLGYNYSRRYYKYSKNGGGSLGSMGATRADEADGTAMMSNSTEDVELKAAPAPETAKKEKAEGDKNTHLQNNSSTSSKTDDTPNISTRKNFNETAFFFPDLTTDAEGNVVLKFTMPEALTKWKLMAFAHTKDLQFGQTERELITQKDLMITSFAPRFLRENDKMTFTAKVSNLSEDNLKGTAFLQLFDASTMKPIDQQFQLTNSAQTFEVAAKSSKGLQWQIKIPEDISAVTYKILAKSGKWTDGEEMTLPILTNRMLVTETMPIWVRSNQTKTFTLDKLKNNSSTTLKNYRYTLELTANPAWYAIQALPYMMEYPYECSEQTFSRMYANSIATHIANSNPKIKQIFEIWRTQDPDALLSNLEKNQELKSLILQETPWVLEAKNESEQKRRVALLFDLNKMAAEQEKAIKRLQKLQTSNGGWPWFDGMQDNEYITQHIVAGFGHLTKLNIKIDKDISNMLAQAIEYIDNRMQERYDNLLKIRPKINMDDNHLGYIDIHYLYTRSFFNATHKLSKQHQKAFDYYKLQAEKYWNKQNRYMQGMIALALLRYGKQQVPQLIIKALKENAIYNEELGMYWKNDAGYYWYEAPIETQALLIEAFAEITKDQKAVDDMRVWLLKNKQTNSWPSTKSTAEACYALLLNGGNWLATNNNVSIQLGQKNVSPSKDIKTEAGTGYFKTAWTGNEIKPEMATVSITKTDNGIAWGGVYWQYFEQLDKITPAKTPLNLKKDLFVEKQTDRGSVIEPIKENELKIGDKIKVRIEIKVDRDMEYVHLKDMRAATCEPVNVLSSYKYQDGLGYYESTKDASTNFFISYLPKGTYVFEYPLRVTHAGNFSNGITTIQCMYAPEFSSHSQGDRITVK